MPTTPTAHDDAADDDDDRVCGQWRDQWDNEYVVTRCQGSYSVVVTHMQTCKKHDTTQTFEDIIKHDANGQYAWGLTHELRIGDGSVLEWRAMPHTKKKTGHGVEFVARGCSSMQMK